MMASVGLMLAATSAPTLGANIRLRAKLSGAAINDRVPVGIARYQFWGDNSQLQIQVKDIDLPGGTDLDVLIDDAVVGQVTIQDMEGRLRLDTRNGDMVPSVGTDSTVVITDLFGITILAGSF